MLTPREKKTWKKIYIKGRQPLTSGPLAEQSKLEYDSKNKLLVKEILMAHHHNPLYYCMCLPVIICLQTQSLYQSCCSLLEIAI